jgi:hypothetical protein
MDIIELLFSRRWRFRKFFNDKTHVISWDSASRQMFNVPVCLFNKVSQQDVAGKATFSEVFETVCHKLGSAPSTPDRFSSSLQVHMHVLNCNLLVRCKFSTCLDRIKQVFSFYIVEGDRSPDYIIDCDWKDCEDELFVFRSSDYLPPMKGVRVHPFGSISNNDWGYPQAPLPPLSIGPLNDQFVGLHSAVVKTPGGKGLLIIGESGSGKTSTALELATNYQCSLLSDEFAFIHKRTALVESFAIPIGIIKPGSEKIYYQAETLVTNLCRDAILITHAVLLERRNDAEVSFERIDAYGTLKLFLNNHQDFQCNIDECILTLMGLAGKISAAKFNYSKYEELIQGCSRFLDFCETTENNREHSNV